MVTNKIANIINLFNENNSFNLFNKMVYIHKMTITKTYSKAFNTFKAFKERPLKSLTKFLNNCARDEGVYVSTFSKIFRMLTN